MLGAFFDEAVELMRRRARGDAKPIMTPWNHINEALCGGLWPGTFSVLTGSTGSGKSQWALQVALGAARAGTPVLYVGLELGRVDLVARVIGLMEAEDSGTAPPWSFYFFGAVGTGNLDRAAAAHGGALKRLPFRLETAPPMGWPISNLGVRAAALRAAHPETRPGAQPILVIVDYLQIVGAENEPKRQDLRERIGRAAACGRAIALEHDAAVLMLSSVSRENAKGIATGDKPWMRPASDFVGLGKESGEIEFSADVVIVLTRGPGGAKWSSMYLGVAKQRAGLTSPAGRWPHLLFNGGWFCKGEAKDEEEKTTAGTNATVTAEEARAFA